MDRIAARGLALLGPRATKAIPRLRDAIKAGVDAEFVGGNSDIILAAIAILKIDNSDRLAAEQLLQALVDAHGFFDATASDEALRLLPGLATQNDYLKVHLVEQLSYQIEKSVDDFDIDMVRSINLHARIIAAKILIKAGIAEVDTLKALENMYHESEFETRGEVIDLIGQLGAKAINQTHVLIESLADAEDYTVGGDFYGNGGEKNRVCDHAVQALVAIGPDAIADLNSKLNDDNKFSRSNTTKALGLIGNTETSVVDDLCKLLEDAEPLVRRETATALGMRVLWGRISTQSLSDTIL